MASKRPPLPPRQQLELPRPDLSAKEGLKIVRSALSETSLDLALIELRVAGSADLSGRLSVNTGSWEMLFWCEERRVAVGSYVFANGNFGAEYVEKPIWKRVPPLIQEPWVDSTVVARAVSMEPVLVGMAENKQLFLSVIEQSGQRFWEAMRNAYDPKTVTVRTHTFRLDMERADVLTEEFKMSKGQTVVESWKRTRE